MATIFNFRMMEPAPLEHLDVLRAKSGVEVDREIYSFKDKGGRDIGLRFDLTVGMTRYVCTRRELRPPIKLASLSGAWRYDEPQHARYRWFRQWDLEIFGPPSIGADAEVIEATHRLFKSLGIGFTVQVGDREAVQSYISQVLGVKDAERAAEMMRALDKVQKKTAGELKAEYVAKGFSAEEVEKLLGFGAIRGDPGKVLSRLGEEGVQAPALVALADNLSGRGIQTEFNLSIVRGLDYYTGVVFEVLDTSHPDLGSLAGGGRYDLLPGSFGRTDLSATGAAGGMERIALSLSDGSEGRSVPVYVAVTGKGGQKAGHRVLNELRDKGVPAESALSDRALAKQLEDARRMGVKWVVILGDKEELSGMITLRNMVDRTEEVVPLSTALRRIKQA